MSSGPPESGSNRDAIVGCGEVRGLANVYPGGGGGKNLYKETSLLLSTI